MGPCVSHWGRADSYARYCGVCIFSSCYILRLGDKLKCYCICGIIMINRGYYTVAKRYESFF